MKKIILSVAIVLTATTAVFAQNTCCDKQPRGYEMNFETAPFWSNWFISANVGAQSFISKEDIKADFGDRLTLFPTLSIGKMFNPYWGVRVQGTTFGGALHTFQNEGTQMVHNYYGSFHGDVMFGLLNFFMPYDANRKFEVSPFAGAGGIYVKDGRHSFTLNTGAQASYKFSKRVAANLEYQAMFMENDAMAGSGYFSGVVHGLTAGVTVNIGKVGFNKAYSHAEYSTLAQDNASLLASVNDLRTSLKNRDGIIGKQNAELNSLRNRKPEVVKTGVNIESLPVAITFPFNSSKVGQLQELNILNLANFLKENPSLNVNLSGYADKTGPDAYNDKLSQKRAKAVKKLLVDKYGIAEGRITEEGKGISTKFDVNAWNRVVNVRMK
jgi:outer membrane protein OmpA-like peptidoglycan-associated protein